MKTYTLEEVKNDLFTPNQRGKYEKELKENNDEQRKFLLVVDVKETIKVKGFICYTLQEIKYEHPNCFYAEDFISALDYCDVVLNIQIDHINNGG